MRKLLCIMAGLCWTSSMAISQPAGNRAECVLPARYIAGQSVLVTLRVTPASGVTVFAIEDAPPTGWKVGEISDGGGFDAVNGRVKWDLFFGSNPRSLTYTVIPPEMANGEASFHGIANFDGTVEVPVMGDRRISTASVATPPTITRNPEAREIEAGQNLTLTVEARGTEPLQYQWFRDASPIPAASEMSFTIVSASDQDEGAYLVKVSNQAGEIASEPATVKIREKAAESKAVRALPATAHSGEAILVTIEVTPSEAVVAYAVEDQPPSGWSIADINQGGEFDPANAKVKWGPFTDKVARTLSYRATPSARTGPASFAGTANFNGEIEVAISGPAQSTVQSMAARYKLAVAPVPQAEISVFPQQEDYAEGAQVRLEVICKPGQVFAGWEGDASGKDNPLTLTMSGDKSVKATFASRPTRTLTVQADAGGSVVRDPNQDQVEDNSIVRLVATAHSGYAFTGWEGDATGEANPLMVQMNGDKSIRAHFNPAVVLRLTSSGGGTVKASPAKDRYLQGEVVRLTAVPAPGYAFGGWTGSMVSERPEQDIKLDHDMQFTAHFVFEGQLITHISGQGIVTRTPDKPSYLQGESVQVQALPADGWQFVEWKGAVTGSTNPAVMMIHRSERLEAVFRQLFPVILSKEGEGTIHLSSPQDRHLDGTTVFVTASAGTGWRFVGWSGDASGTENPLEVMVNTNRSITAVFKPDSTHRVLVAIASPGGTVTREPDLAEYVNGTAVRVTASPLPDYEFSEWEGDAKGKENPLSLLMDRDKSVRARFRDARTPQVEITSPGETRDSIYTLSGRVTDNVGVAEVRWERPGRVGGSVRPQGNDFTQSGLRLLPGPNLFRVTAIDQEGNQATVEKSVIWRPQQVLAAIEPEEQQEGNSRGLTVPLVLTSDGNVSGMTFALQYDPDYLESPVFSTYSSLGHALAAVNTNPPGVVTITFSSVDPLPGGEVLLGAITFQIRSIPFSLATDLELDLLEISDPSGASLTRGFSVDNAEGFLHRRRLLGDINANDKYDTKDAGTLQKLIAGTLPRRPWDLGLNDINGNNLLDSGDVTRILRAVCRIDPQPQVQGPTNSVPARSAGLKRLRIIPPESMLRPALSVNEPQPGASSLSPGTLQGQPGELVTVQLRLEGVMRPISGLSFAMEFPVEALRLVSQAALRKGEIVPADAEAIWNISPAQNNLSIQDGRIYFAASRASAWPETKGVLAEFTFQVQPGARKRSSWLLRVAELELALENGSIAEMIDADAVFRLRTVAPPAPAIVKADLIGNIVRFSLQATSPATYKVQSSTDLRNWAPLRVLTGSGLLSFEEEKQPGETARFYRVLSTP